MDIKATISERLKGSFPYPDFKGTDLIVYDFLVEERTKGKHQDGWILDLHTGEFKYPLEKLNNTKMFWNNAKINGKTNNIRGTNIFWKNQNDMFVFWLE